MRPVVNQSQNRYLITNSEPLSGGLPPGMYAYDVGNFGVTMIQQELQSSKIILDREQTVVYKNIEKFWESKALYDQMGITHKRGFLLYGPPGTGKTTLVRYAIQELIAQGGYVLDTVNREFPDTVRALRESNPSARILAVLEDVEDYDEGNLTEIMDGLTASDGLLFLATTNYISHLSGRLANRPSRFDEKISIGYPGEIARRAYVASIAVAMDKKAQEEIVAISSGISMAHIKELIIQKLVYKKDIDELRILAGTYKQQCEDALKEFDCEE